MELSYEQKVCFDDAMAGNNLLISGPGGTGKSFVLEAITEELGHRDIRYAVTASTGVAALNVGGSTIHSFLGTGLMGSVKEAKLLLGTKSHHYAVERILNLQCLIIDEISMLSGDYLEMVNFWLQQTRSEPNETFGGCQVILCGDFLQLPPVEKKHKNPPQWRYAFNAPCWAKANFKTIDLQHSFRQEDKIFVNALNRVRFGDYNKTVRKVFRPCIGRELENPTHLVGTNKTADSINLLKLIETQGAEYKHKPKFEIHKAALRRNPEWAADVEAKLLRDSLTDSPLRLKIGVPVLLLKNTGAYVNGSRGVVTAIQQNHKDVSIIEAVMVKLEKEEKTVRVEPAEWRKIDSDGQVEMVMKHFPIRLGWAITIHKSQGLTLDNVEIDPSEIFACGQAYVALSRLKSLEGLSLSDAIDPASVKADEELVSFYDQIVVERGGDVR